MYDLCPACGTRRDDPGVDPDAPAIVCGACGHRESFRRPPLRVILGAAATGKSTVWRRLGEDVDATSLDVDRLRGETDGQTTGDGEDPTGEAFVRRVLSLCHQIAQSGGPPVVFSRYLVPDLVSECPERHYFESVEYLALVCDGEDLKRRILSRPGVDEYHDRLDADREFERNRRFREDLDVDRLNTSDQAVWETTDAVREWIEART